MVRLVRGGIGANVGQTIAYGIINQVEGQIKSVMKSDLAALDATVASAIYSFSPSTFRMSQDKVVEFSEKMAEAMRVLEVAA